MAVGRYLPNNIDAPNLCRYQTDIRSRYYSYNMIISGFSLVYDSRRLFVNGSWNFLRQSLRFFPHHCDPVHPVRIGQLILLVLLATEIYPSQPTVSVHLDADRLHVGRLERVAHDLSQFQAHSVPTLVHAHRLRDHERTDL